MNVAVSEKRTMKRVILPTFALILATLSAGSLGQETSVNCDTAKEDIAKLEAEKKSSLEQMEKGVTSVMPSTAVLHLMTGTQQESKEIASGEYNERIDAHIERIKSTCGIE
ncbi:MAG: hypothetical protein AMJ58_11735 [Gammaproteobacteria bacterium SG8_30]|jgi:hypothetical protein|nr:MAG: hypothetical protein AMJ58_11735 [Gammaproteobacteria bacterium SG8_30]